MLLLTFQAAGNSYAVDVRRVVEVLPRVHCRRLPHAPAFLAGIFDYRGVVVPVIDLGILLGAGACRDQLGTRVIVVNLQPTPGTDLRPEGGAPADQPEGSGCPDSQWRGLAGLIAEHVSDVAKVRPDQVISSPVNLPQAPYLGAIVDLGGEMIQLIIVDRLLDQSFRVSFFEGSFGAVVEREAAEGS